MYEIYIYRNHTCIYVYIIIYILCIYIYTYHTCVYIIHVCIYNIQVYIYITYVYIYINTYTYKRFYLCTNYSGILSSAMRFQLAQPRGSPFSAQFHFNKMEASIRKATLWILRIQTLESFVEKESSCPSC